jgi:hypothetical protein
MNAKALFFPDRIGRLEYLVRYLPPNLALAYLLSSEDDPSGSLVAIVITLSLALIPFAILPRIRDSGTSYWVLIFAFIPILDRLLGLILLFKGGVPFPVHQEPNQALEPTAPSDRASS